MEVRDGAIERARSVRLLLLDVDGVLTDGRFLVGPDGAEHKAFHSRDGLGLRLAQREGIAIGLVSGRRSAAVEHRARELGIDEVHLGVRDKLDALADIVERLGLDDSQVGYAGDDLVDLPVLRRVGLAATVPEAPGEVRRYAHVVTGRGGGHGAVRELVELILDAQGRWPSIVAKFGGGEEGP